MVLKLTPDATILALDLGDKHIGVARANATARIPEPLPPLVNNEMLLSSLKDLVDDYGAQAIVIGLPRNMKGEETAQSRTIRDVSEQIREAIDVPVTLVDESLSSVRADRYLSQSKKTIYSQHSVAACYILEEFFTTREEL